MRLWHQDLISMLPRQQLLGQHRECCALRGNGWGKQHATVNYVFEHDYGYLAEYHKLIMQEMKQRGYRVDPSWEDSHYRGKNALALASSRALCMPVWKPIYPEHNHKYLEECLLNLEQKGIHLEVTK
jgi:uncharacterized protein (TIGR02328 family)